MERQWVWESWMDSEKSKGMEIIILSIHRKWKKEDTKPSVGEIEKENQDTEETFKV